MSESHEFAEPKNHKVGKPKHPELGNPASPAGASQFSQGRQPLEPGRPRLVQP
jgi:hypothetical protein